MEKFCKKGYLVPFLAILLIGFTACSDSGTDAGDETPPEIPELNQYQPDLSFFNTQQKTAAATANGEAFTTAQSVVNTLLSPLFSTGNVFLPFVQQAQTSSPEFSDGKWVWTYSYSVEGQTADVRLEATINESLNEASWELFVSTSGTDGQNFDNYNFMDGTTSLDGREGEWFIFPYSDDTGTSPSPVFTLDWSVDTDDNLTSTYTIDDPQSNSSFTVTYQENGVERTITATSSDGEVNLEIFWNTETSEGYVIYNGQQQCWDSSLNDVECT